MKKLVRFLPIYTVAAGLICGLLRQELFADVDAKGLVSLTHSAILPTVILTAVMGLMLLLCGLWAPKKDFRLWIPVPVQALGCLAAACGFFYTYLTDPDSTGLFQLMGLLTAVLFLAMTLYRVQMKKVPLMIPALLSLCMLLLCFGQYRQWGQYTQAVEYLFPSLETLLVALYSLEFCNMELPDKPFKKAYLLNQGALFFTLAAMDTSMLPYTVGISLWLLSGLFATPCRMRLPQDVQYCIDTLENKGYTVYTVGGCVRDAMLGLTPNDYDLTTNATPEQISQAFSRHQLVRSGEKHGTIGVVLGQTVYEITTFRKEGDYSDNRHPDSVTFVDDVREDLARRDFTVNAMAFHPKTGYVDPFGGQKDLCAGVLRAVGDPETRFREDALRILRGVRFACRFRLKPEEKTGKAMEELAPLMENLAKERIFAELNQILCHGRQEDLVTYRLILLTVIPELSPCVDFQQHSPYHSYDVFTHTVHVFAKTEPSPVLRWAALLHDTGKPGTFTKGEDGKGHFLGHAQESARIADGVLRRLKAPNALREQVVFLIEHHMDVLKAEKSVLRRKLSKYGAENLQLLIKLQTADQAGKGRASQKACNTGEKMLQLVAKLLKEEGCLQVRDLAIDGNDLMALGFEAGPRLGQCQKALLEMVLSGKIPNEKDALTQKAREILKR